MDRLLTEQLKRYYQLWRETNEIYEEWAKRYGLSYYELLILLSLWEEAPDCTQKKICEQWLLPKQTVHSILQNFCKKELVSFRILKADRRNKAVLLTTKGKAFADDVLEGLQEHERQVLQRLGPRRVEALIDNTALFIQYFREGGEDEHT